MMPSYNIRHKFAQPVAMKCTSAQIKFLVGPLKELGYQVEILDTECYLATHARAKDSLVLTYAVPPPRGYLVEGFQWELFLAIAAMTEGDKFIRGEYGVAKGNIGDKGKTIIREGQLVCAYEVTDTALRILTIGACLQEWFRKPTLDEIINYFNPNKTMDQKPSAGRIVIFVLPDTDLERFSNNNATEAPAVITRVFDPESGMINMKVLLDGPDTPWVTSVKYSEEPLPRTWHWPARV